MLRAESISLPGPLLIVPERFGDDRGFFQETYRQSELSEFGIDDDFVQDNQSRSSHGVLRGMHFQVGEGIAKLVRCAHGKVLDVVVDIRRGSPTFGKWASVTLDDVQSHELYVPVGFAHGFVTLSDLADVVYKQSGYFSAELERTISYDDPDIGIEWPQGIEFTISPRDAGAPRLSEIADELPFTYVTA